MEFVLNSSSKVSPLHATFELCSQERAQPEVEKFESNLNSRMKLFEHIKKMRGAR